MENKKPESIEPMSEKLKRIMSRPTTEEIPKMPEPTNDAFMGMDLYSKRKAKKPSL